VAGYRDSRGLLVVLVLQHTVAQQAIVRALLIRAGVQALAASSIPKKSRLNAVLSL